MSFLNNLRRTRWIILGRKKIKGKINALSLDQKLKINLGSGETTFEGWIATDLPHFDITKESDWEYFLGDRKIDNLLAEHVLEHLTEEDVNHVLQLAFQYMKKGGIFRIAVPDGYNPDPSYLDVVSPSGYMGSYQGHKVLWNYQSLGKAANDSGWTTRFLEYHDTDGNFVSVDFSSDDGYILRCSRNVSAGQNLSLLVDCSKN